MHFVCTVDATYSLKHKGDDADAQDGHGTPETLCIVMSPVLKFSCKFIGRRWWGQRCCSAVCTGAVAAAGVVAPGGTVVPLLPCSCLSGISDGGS